MLKLFGLLTIFHQPQPSYNADARNPSYGVRLPGVPWDTTSWASWELQGGTGTHVVVTGPDHQQGGSRAPQQCSSDANRAGQKSVMHSGAPWRRKWQPTPVLLPGRSHGRRSLVDYSPWVRKESDTTKWLNPTQQSPRLTLSPFLPI